MSEIQRITVSGNSLVKTTDIIKASGFSEGSFYFGISENKASERIQKIPTIEKVTVEKRFPGLANISVTEHPIVAYLADAKSSIFPVLSSGYVMLESTNPTMSEDAPLLTGWENKEEISFLCLELKELDDYTLTGLSEIRRSPTDNFPKRLVVYTRTGYEIHIEYDQLAEKLPEFHLMVQEVMNRESERGIFYLLGDVAVFKSYHSQIEEGEGEEYEEQNEDESQN